MPNIDSQILSDRARAELAAKLSQTGEGVNTDYVSLTTGVKPISYVSDTGLQIGSYPIAEGVVQRVKWNDSTNEWDDFGPVYVTVEGAKVSSVETLKTRKGAIDGQTVELLGYYENGDGGGGTLYWDSSSTSVDNGGSVLQVNGVLTGRWIRPDEEYVNVKKFGAKGDDIANDYASIQNAINSFNVVYFPSGTYRSNQAINLKNGSVLFSIENETAEIKNTSTASIFLFVLDSIERVLIDGLSIYGNANVNYDERLIFAKDCDKITVRNCCISKTNTGLSLQNCKRVEVISNKFTEIVAVSGESNGYGILSFGECEELIISHNMFSDIERHAIYFSQGTRDSSISENIINNCRHNSINLNSIEGQRGQQNININFNIITLCGRDGIHLVGQNRDVNIISNQIIDPIQYGILITGVLGDSITISKNRIISSGAKGIYIDIIDSNIVTDNYIRQSIEEGIYINGSKNNNIQNNIIDGCNHGIRSEASNSFMNTISSNTILRSVLNGIFITNSDYNKLCDNYIQASGEFGIRLTFQSESNHISANYIIDSSQKTDNTFDNISVVGGQKNLISNNICRLGDLSNGARYGIDVQTNDNLIINNDLLNSGKTLSLNVGGSGNITTSGNRE